VSFEYLQLAIRSLSSFPDSKVQAAVMPPIPHRIRVRNHPGSSLQDIKNEPDWGSGHEHRVGFRNTQNRVPGLTHSGDEREEDSDPLEDVEAEQAAEKYVKFRDEAADGKLVNFRDLINAQEDLHLRRPEVHSEGWRFVLNAREDWVKNTENWPANLERKAKEEEAKKKQQPEEKQSNGDTSVKSDKSGKDGEQGDDIQQEHEWKRENGEGNKHHDAYPGSDADAEDSSGDESKKSEYQILREKYSPQEIALLRSLQHEKDYIYNLKQNDGKRKSATRTR
jgi:nitrate reductase (NAD(P)H)